MLSLAIKAKNSSGTQHLIIDTDKEGNHFLTLVGSYNGEPIQIDFDEMNDNDISDFVTLLISRKRGG